MNKHIIFKRETLPQTGSDGMQALGIVLISVGIAAALYFVLTTSLEGQKEQQDKDKDNSQADPELNG